MPSSPMTRPAPLACGECRRKHLKCDGVMPVCARCNTDSLVCEYRPSRRGYGRQRRQEGNGAARRATTGGRHFSRPPTPRSSGSGSISGAFQESALHSADTFTTPLDPTDIVQTVSSSSAASVGFREAAIDKELLINAYYAHFHPAHPLLVPRSAYERQHYPVQLERVVCFIGRCYVPCFADPARMDEEVKALSSSLEIDTSISSVQALILCTIAFHSLCYSEQALAFIKRAGTVARELGLNHRDGNASGAALVSVEAESVRRTWWELYTMDSYLAALHRRPSFACEPGDVYPLLPGLASGSTNVLSLVPPSLSKFEARFFSSESFASLYSPYAYRIEAVRILRRILCLSAGNDSSADATEAADNAIASWKHYLPESGASFSAGEPGEAESLFLQAHCFIHTASILLHFPRSELPAKIPSARDIVCARNWTHEVRTSSLHTMKAINASKEIANLAALPFSVDFYPPLFTCALIMACIVQLAASSTLVTDLNDATLLRHRDRVVVLLGALSQLGRRWKMASHGADLLKLVADRIFSKPSNDFTFGVESVPQQNFGTEDWWSNIPWFDLFSTSDPQGLVANQSWLD